MESTPRQISSLDQSLVQDEFSACRQSTCRLPEQDFLFWGVRNLDDVTVYASQIKKLRKIFFSGTSSFVGQFLHPSPVQSSRSIQLMQAVKLFLNKFFFLTGNLEERPDYALQIKKLRKRLSGGTSSLVGQFLHPSPVQSSRSIQLMQAVKLSLNKFFFLAGNLEERPDYALQIKKLRKRLSGGTSSLVGQFLHPSPVQSSRSIQLMQAVKLFLNKFFFLGWQFGRETSLCFTDQETQEEIFW